MDCNNFGLADLTQQWLLGVEIISHALNLVIETFNLTQDGRQILEYYATRCIWMLLRELCKIVANATSNVDNEQRIIFGLGALDQSLSNRKETRIHPAGSSLAVAAHVMVELRSIRRVCLQIRKEVELGVVGVLVRTVFRIAWLYVASLRGEEIEVREGGDCTTSSGKRSDILLAGCRGFTYTQG
jgi:hypothetical protein